MDITDDFQYRCRETYFLWFSEAKRPPLANVVEIVRELKGHFTVEQPVADDDGLVESLTVRSSEDHSALEIEFQMGEDVREEAATLATDLKAGDGGDPAKLKQLAKSDARFEIMHFEQVDDDADEDELFDPSALLEVLEALAKLTGGVAVDPQSGMLL